MSAPLVMTPQLTDSDRYAERRRARELFKHYHPGAIDPPSTHDTNEDLTQVHARLSQDLVLQGLAQLAATRTNCHHAFVSLFDYHNQYILAEATRFGPLLPAKEGGNKPLIGPCIIDWAAGWGKTSMKYFCAEEGSRSRSTENVTGDQSCFIVNDLSLDDKMSEKQITKLYSQWRFVAEVPIKSPRGYVLGSLSVIDDKPRNGMSEEDIRYLHEVSQAVLEHLDLLKMQSTHTRSDHLGKGLGLFLEGKTSLRDWWVDRPENANKSKTMPDLEREKNLNERSDRMFGSVPSPDQASSSSNRSSYASIKDEAAPSAVDESDSESMQHVMEPSPSARRAALPSKDDTKAHEATDGEVNTTGQPEDQHDSAARQQATLAASVAAPKPEGSKSLTPDNASLSEAIEGMFSRASNLLREAMEVEGNVFMSATHCEPGKQGLRKYHHGSASAESQSSNSEDESRALGIPKRRVDPSEPGNSGLVGSGLQVSITQPCQIIGYSNRATSSVAGNAATSDTPSLSEATLRRFLKYYPNGTAFTFDQDGMVSSTSEEDVPASKLLFREAGSSYFKETGAPARSKKRRRADGDVLLRLIPGARSVVFYPLWDFHKDRWYAGVLAWTKDQSRTFEADDISYFAIFGNCIMAELSRIESIYADRAKSDFISSISHELRSPLHGVLGGAELLQDTSTGTVQDDMIRMIEICGRTLLDTMDHLLDFAKINNITTGPSGKLSRKKKAEGALGRWVSVDLADLVEDVVESVFAGHTHSNSASSLFHMTEGGQKQYTSVSSRPTTPKATPIGHAHKAAIQNTMVIVDVEKRDSWVFNSQVGGWKRLLMNIFGNALKYTQSGIISVSLRSCQNLPESPSTNSTIKLSVSDTGRGISSDYLKHDIFKPFSQENSLSVGTGLGMSIVQQIASTMGAVVKIESEVGRGTKVDLTVTLEAAPSENIQTRTVSSAFPIHELCRNRRALLYGFDKSDSSLNTSSDSSCLNRQIQLLGSFLEDTLRHWLDMEVVEESLPDTVPPELLFVHESQLERFREELASSQQMQEYLQSTRVLVFCSEAPKTLHLVRAVQVLHPYGVRKVMTAINQALDGNYSESQRSISASSATKSPSHGASSPIFLRQGPRIASIKDDSSPTRRPHPNLPFRTPEYASGSASPPQSQFSPKRHSAPPQTQHLSSRSFLLVDDNEINLKLLSGFMRKLKCPYSTASNGAEAVEAYAGALTKPAIVLMDVSMPLMDGFEATREIRRLEKEMGVDPATIIALTGLGSQDARRQALANGMDLFLTKPVSFKRLKEILGEAG